MIIMIIDNQLKVDDSQDIIETLILEHFFDSSFAAYSSFTSVLLFCNSSSLNLIALMLVIYEFLWSSLLQTIF